MKKVICVLLLATILSAGIGGIITSAAFGSGVEVISNDVTLIKTGLLGQKMKFSDADFKSALCIADFDKIKITSLPSSTTGDLLLAGRRVSEGQTVKRRNVAALVFVPRSSEITEAEFSFTIDSNEIQTVCKMKFIDKVNYAPTTNDVEEASLSLTTQSQITVFGKMSANDPEGDALEYIIVSFPENGYISVTDKENGRFKYTPNSEFTGYDKFTYVARDCYGNFSEPVSYNIKVTKRLSEAVYVDMTNRSEYNAAVAMNALGIMSGKTLGDSSFFMPDDTVTKAEFVAMALKAYGIKPKSNLSNSFFDDNADIPQPLISYVATAAKMGILDGEWVGGKLLFKPNEVINSYEAADVIARLIDAKASGEDLEFDDVENLPVWAKSSVSVMYTLGIFDEEQTDITAAVTRADAAEYLYRMIKIK